MNSLVILMEDREFSKIATVDIISQSEVSKSTFYKYFFDKYDLVNQMLEEFYSQLKLIFQQAREKDSIVDFYQAFSQYLNHHHDTILCILNTKDDNINLREKFQNLIKKDYLLNTKHNEFDADYFALTFQWSVNYMLQQKRYITPGDIKEIDHKINLVELVKINPQTPIYYFQPSFAK